MQPRQCHQVFSNRRTDLTRPGHGRLESQGQGGPHRWSGRGIVVAFLCQSPSDESTHSKSTASESAPSKSTHAEITSARRVGLGRADEVLLGRLSRIGADEGAGHPRLATDPVRAVQACGALAAALAEAAQRTAAAEGATRARTDSAARRAVTEHA